MEKRGHLLVEAGVALFLIGLFIGLAVPAFANPRLGLASGAIAGAGGAAWGSLIGWLIRTERWAPVEIDVVVSAADGAIGLRWQLDGMPYR